jgi:hypothetical protein
LEFLVEKRSVRFGLDVKRVHATKMKASFYSIDQEHNLHPHPSPLRCKAGLHLVYSKQGQIDIETEIGEAITREQFLMMNPLLSPVGTTGD